MVGPLKSIHDLRRIDAQVRAVCRSCEAERIYDLNDLIAVERVIERGHHVRTENRP